MDPASASPPRHTRLDAYRDRYAERTHGMQASEIRALFAVASRPEVVSLAGGMPNISGLPLDAIGATLKDLVLDRGDVAMQYSSGQGDPTLREQICEVMADEAISTHPDDVTITVGSQQALDLTTRMFCDPHDVLVCEAPSYVGALGVFSSYQCTVEHVAMDDDGLIPEALEQTLAQQAAQGRAPKFVYVIPNYHNPAGVTMPVHRRERVLEICRDSDVLVVEDNPYGLLGFDSDPRPALHAMDPERVVYLGSFSKTFAPGFRVGWIVAPHAVREKLVLAQESATLCPPTFSQLAVSAYLSQHDWRSQIKQFQQMYAERRDAMLAALEEHMPTGTTWTQPTGGFYVWLTVPEGVDTKAMLPKAVTDRVAYVPGTAFYSGGSGTRSMRLSYCYPSPERIQEGVRRLAGVIEAELDLHKSVGHTPPTATRGYESPNPDLS